MPSLNKRILQEGPLLTIRIGVTAARRELLLKANFPVPEPVQIPALLDTGSFITLADNAAIARLGIPAYGRQQFYSSATGTASGERNEFDVSVTILDNEGGTFYFWPSVAILEAKFLEDESVQAIIGRDLLAFCVFNYYGKERFFTVTV